MPSSEEVLTRVRDAGTNDRFRVTAPVDQKLRDGHLTMGDVRHALAGARVCVEREDGTFRVGGPDLDGAALSLVVIVEDESVIVISEEER